MVKTGVLLYGPPASGKDTITATLCADQGAFVPFRRLKAGEGRTQGYRYVTSQELDDLSRQQGEILYRNSRYGAEYAIDRTELERLLDSGRIPVIHVGQVAAVLALLAYPARWVPVLLWCPRDVTAARCQDRGDSDAQARLRAWDETLQDLVSDFTASWALALHTDRVSPEEAASLIDSACKSPEIPMLTTADFFAELA